MAENIVVSFALLFAATLTLIAAVYVALGHRKRAEQSEK